MGHLDDFDLVYDERFTRRLKRRRFDIKSFELSACNLSLRRILEDGRLGDEMVDDDYKNFLTCLGAHSESGPSMEEEDDDDGEDEDDSDPHYKMFLENLREDGKSYVLEVAKNDGMTLCIKYEVDYGTDNDCEPQTWRKSRNSTKEEKMETEKNLRNIPSKDKVENPIFSRSVPVKESQSSVVKKNLMYEPLNPVSHGIKERSSQKLSPEDNHISKPQSRCDMEGVMIDDSYQAFLNCIKPEGDCLVFEIGNGKRVKYEEVYVDCSSDSEILVSDNAPFSGEGNYTPFVPSKVFNASVEEDDSQCLRSLSKKGYSQFREKLMVILKRPYDQKEFDELLEEVEARKAKEGRRDLRSGIKSYPEDICSKSYFDHHCDLKRKIDAQPDRRRKLIILRGFFYWLQNLSHDDAFKPWLDTSCLEVLPGSH